LALVLWFEPQWGAKIQRCLSALASWNGRRRSLKTSDLWPRGVFALVRDRRWV
jgi:hypothetical protein